ncbi:Fibrous sheath-interacting protein 2 [Manis javanica]|nr:Fibrous sheath-interacting protein 2 [Manis javanica]
MGKMDVREMTSSVKNVNPTSKTAGELLKVVVIDGIILSMDSPAFLTIRTIHIVKKFIPFKPQCISRCQYSSRFTKRKLRPKVMPFTQGETEYFQGSDHTLGSTEITLPAAARAAISSPS